MKSFEELEEADMPFFGAYERNKEEIKAKITSLSKDTGKDEILQDLITGQRVFLDGARGAAREAGWDINKYEFYQSYLSNWVHSHPVSFMRAEEQKISFSDPSPFQLDFCSTVLEMATYAVISVADRMESFSGSRSRDPLH